VLSVADANLQAEVRFVESGRRMLAHAEGGLRCLSDTHGDLGKAYRVTFHAPYAGSAVVFTCTPEGERAYEDDHLHVVGGPGVVPCLHAAGAARRLEREGLIRLTHLGEWVATAAAAKPAPTVEEEDVFATFNGR